MFINGFRYTATTIYNFSNYSTASYFKNCRFLFQNDPTSLLVTHIYMIYMKECVSKNAPSKSSSMGFQAKHVLFALRIILLVLYSINFIKVYYSVEAF